MANETDNMTFSEPIDNESNVTMDKLFIYTPIALSVSGVFVWCALVLTSFQVSSPVSLFVKLCQGLSPIAADIPTPKVLFRTGAAVVDSSYPVHSPVLRFLFLDGVAPPLLFCLFRCGQELLRR